MGNKRESLTKEFIGKVENLPYFTIDHLKVISAPPYQKEGSQHLTKEISGLFG